jgi:hypothetical protein
VLIDTAIGMVGGQIVGEVLPAVAKTYLSRDTKRAIGEGLTEVGLRAVGLSFTRNLEKLGMRPLGQTFTRQVSNGVGKSTFDFQLSTGRFIESKFGTSGLSAPQRTAARNLGDELEVQYWNYPRVSGLATTGPSAAFGAGK